MILNNIFRAGVLTVGLFSPHISFADTFTTELVAANPSAGFNFPYVLRIPNKFNGGGETVLLVESNNSGTNNNFDAQITAAMSFAAGNGVGPFAASQLEIPLLVPVFPRTKSNWKTYTHSLDRDTIAIKQGSLYRLDIQLIKMVDDARVKMSAQDITVLEKFLMCGFSASGAFSNRFAFLHPERMLGVVSGGVNAFPMLPVSKFAGEALNYPLGVNDLQDLIGRPFNTEAWLALPQLIFMGALDDNDAVKFSDAYSRVEREVIYSVIGRPMAQRWQRVQQIYLSEKANVTFVTYGGIGHWTNGRINRDIANFLRSIIQETGGKDET